MRRVVPDLDLVATVHILSRPRAVLVVAQDGVVLGGDALQILDPLHGQLLALVHDLVGNHPRLDQHRVAEHGLVVLEERVVGTALPFPAQLLHRDLFRLGIHHPPQKRLRARVLLFLEVQLKEVLDPVARHRVAQRLEERRHSLHGAGREQIGHLGIARRVTGAEAPAAQLAHQASPLRRQLANQARSAR
eukprot:scaffold256_cov261-Pinguiococcus_pyrenoidosus.AAC.31